MQHTIIIAEAGVNHNGSLELAQELIDAAVDAGADAVKFQTFQAKELVTPETGKAEYQKRRSDAAESMYDMLRKLELDESSHRKLLEHCQRRGISFLSTPFDAPSLAWLTSGLGLRTLKISSGDITNGPLLLQAAATGADVILSTGMSLLGEIEEALSVLAFGYTADAAVLPSRAAFREAFISDAGQAALRQHVTVLHCTSEYPAPPEDVNLGAMRTLRTAFGLPVGLSDHSRGIHIPVAAAALGATMIEKHFTLDRTLPGPDHQASLEPSDLKAMISAIRDVEHALGSGVKRPAPSERKNEDVVRKSIVAARPIETGEPFTAENLGLKRPGDGRSPMDYWDLLGRPAMRAYRANAKVTN